MLANISNSLEMQLGIKFSSDLEYFQVYKQQDNAMFGDLFCEIELRDVVVFLLGLVVSHSILSMVKMV